MMLINEQIANQKSPPLPMTFVAAGTVISKLKLRKPSLYAWLLQSARDWIFQVDLDTGLHFPAEVAVTSLRKDINLWSKASKTVILCELAFPWEGHAE